MLRKVSGLLVVGLLILAPQAWGADLQQSIDAYLTQLPADFETVSCKTLSTKQSVGENVFVLDVREPAEYQAGHIEGAVNIPVRTLAKNLDKLPADKAMPIAVVCKSGIRAAYATMTLKLLGYGNVKDVAGGMMAWEKEGLPVTKQQRVCAEAVRFGYVAMALNFKGQSNVKHLAAGDIGGWEKAGYPVVK